MNKIVQSWAEGTSQAEETVWVSGEDQTGPKTSNGWVGLGQQGTTFLGTVLPLFCGTSTRCW